ncbi:MAG: deoxyribose-phosphate aldolase [Ruminococcus sp.]|nr:deoxyribose-phosphate aldolase [Ruminococcus sp.]
MTNSEILSRIDHTQLKAVAKWEDIEKLCREAVEYKTASVCIPPSYISRVRKAFPDLNICTVIGFPLGYSTTAAKITEAETAIADGADEIDTVINIGDAKNGDFEKITKEISAIKSVIGDRILKVIIETCYLDEEEKINLCECVTIGGADYIKTSTGFGTGGAVLSDIELFKKHIGGNVKIKAAGGVRTRDDLEAFINAGCDRIGTSGAVAILTGGENNAY